jgi:hypothetical protein
MLVTHVLKKGIKSRYVREVYNKAREIHKATNISGEALDASHDTVLRVVAKQPESDYNAPYMSSVTLVITLDAHTQTTDNG